MSVSSQNAPEGSLNKIPRGYQQSGVCSRITKELCDTGPRGEPDVLIIVSMILVVIIVIILRNMTICTFRFKKQLRRLQDGNSYSERRWNNGGWRQFWSFSSYWTSWVKTTSDRSLNELMPPARLCSQMPTSLPWMSFISLLGLRGTMMWGMFGFNGASDKSCLFPLERSICCVISRLTDQYEQASIHLWELLEGRDKAVAGTTCTASWLLRLMYKCWFGFDLRHCFRSRQVPEGHPAQSAAQRLPWQSADSSEWNMPGGRGRGAAICCGWVPGCGAAIRTWYELQLHHLHLCACEISFYVRPKKQSFILHPVSRRSNQWKIRRASSSGNHRGWFADVLLYKPSSPLSFCCFVTITFFLVIVCEQTVHSRNNIQHYRQRPDGGVDSRGSGMCRYPAWAFLHSTIFKLRCLFTL